VGKALQSRPYPLSNSLHSSFSHAQWHPIVVRLPPSARVSGEEALQSFGGMFGSLFRKEMAGIERVAFNIVAPGLPKCDWPAGLCIPRIQWPVSAPQC